MVYASGDIGYITVMSISANLHYAFYTVYYGTVDMTCKSEVLCLSFMLQ